MSFGINVLGRNVIEVGADLSDYNREITKTEREAEKKGSLIGRTFSSGFTKFATLGFGAVTAGVAGLGALALKTGIDYNALQQASRAALTTILHGAEAANAQMDKLDEFARNSPFAKQVFIKAQQQLLGFGLAAHKVLPALDAIQNSVAAVGAGNEAITSITDAFAEMQSAGKLTGETLSRLSAYGIDAVSIIAAELKTTGEDIRELASKPGGLSIERVWDPLVNGLQKRFGGAAKNVKDTWVGSTDRIKAAWRDMGSALAEPFVGHKGGGLAIEWVNKFADLMRAVQKQIPAVMEVFIPRLSGGLSQVNPMLERAKLAVEGFDPKQLLVVVDVFSRLKTTVAPVVGALIGLGQSVVGQVFSDLASAGKFLAFTVLPPIVENFEWLRNQFPMLNSEGTTLVGVLGSDGLAGALTLGVEALIAWKAATMGYGALTGTVDAVKGKFDSLKGTVDTLRGVQKDNCKEQQECLDKQNSKLTTMADNIKKLVGQSVRVPVNIVSPPQEAMTKIAGGMSGALAQALTASLIASFGISVIGAFLAPLIVPALIGVAVVAVAAFAWKFREQIGNFFTNTLPTFFREKITPAFEGLTGAIGNFFTNTLPTFFKETVPAAFGSLTDAISNFVTVTLPQTLHMLPYWFGYYTGLVLGTIMTFSIDLGIGITNAVIQLPGIVAFGFGAAWNWIATEVPTWPGKIYGFISLIPPFFGRVIGDAYRLVTAGLSNLWNWIKTEIPTWPGRFIAFVEPLPLLAWDTFNLVRVQVTERLTSLWNWIKTEVPTWPGRFVGFLSALPDQMWNMAKRAVDSFLDPMIKLKDWLGDALNDSLEPLRQFARGFNDAMQKVGSDIRIPVSWFTIGPAQGGGNPNVIPMQAIRGYARGGWMGLGGPELAVTGEDGPRYPELAIPTNPRYRDRAMGLLSQLPVNMLPFDMKNVKRGVDFGSGLFGRGGVSDAIANAFSGVKQLAGGAVDTVLDWSGKGAKWVWDNLIMKGVGNIAGPGMIGELVKGAGSKLFGSGFDFFKGLLEKASGLLPAMAPGLGMLSGVGPDAGGGWFRPLLNYVITQLFGPASGALGYGFHTGIDLAAPTGTPVYAARSGTVTLSGWYDGYGNAVTINHGGGWATLYGHHSQNLVRAGQTVTGGQMIARVGSTGNSTGPHSHFETLFNGIHRNPRGVIAMGNGGWIREPILGLGASGAQYLFGERGDEEVVPGGRSVYQITINARTVDMDERALLRQLQRLDARYGR